MRPAGWGAHGATFAAAAAEWLRYIAHDRKRKPSTVEGYASIVRAQLLPTFGSMAIEAITPAAIERWLGSLEQASSSRTKSLVLLHGIFQRARKVWGLAVNPVADLEKPPLERSGDIEVFSPEEVWALVRAAGSERDGTSRAPDRVLTRGRKAERTHNPSPRPGERSAADPAPGLLGNTFHSRCRARLTAISSS